MAARVREGRRSSPVFLSRRRLPAAPTDGLCFTPEVRIYAFALLAAGCSGKVVSGGSESNQQTEAQEGGSCQYPANVDVNSDPSSSGCFAGPAKQICEVSNGATVNAEDGGVSGGTESCRSLCGPSQYGMTCMGANSDPDPSLGCQVIPIPTPSCCLYYCCPCAE
jgi:hypothetical protein